MLIQLTYDKELNILRILIRGELSLKDIEVSMQEIFNSADYPSDVNSLWDISELDFNNIDIEFIQQLVLLRKNHNQQRKTAKIAILSDYVLGAPIIKLYTILSSELDEITRTFKRLEDA